MGVGWGWVVRWPGALCASGGWHIVGLMVVWDAMCERWLAHLRMSEVSVAGRMPWIGCFSRLLCCGSAGGCVMCERWLAHSGADGDWGCNV